MTWQPYREPLQVTVLRNGTIVLIGGAIIALFSRRVQWLTAILLMLWPSFGGHCVEVLFLNWLRPHLSVARGAQMAARLGVWFIGGAVMAVGAGLTAMVFAGFRPASWPAWWLGGLAFTGIELVAHLVLQLRGRPSFYNGRG